MDSGSVDFILCTEALEHVYGTRQFLAQARRCLSRGGRILFTVPFAARWHYIPYDYWRFTPSSLKRILTESGFCRVSVYARRNEITVACYKVMALLLPLLLPQGRRPVTAIALRLIGVLFAPVFFILATCGNLSLRGSGGDDCLGIRCWRKRASGNKPLAGSEDTLVYRAVRWRSAWGVLLLTCYIQPWILQPRPTVESSVTPPSGIPIYVSVGGLAGTYRGVHAFLRFRPTDMGLGRKRADRFDYDVDPMAINARDGAEPQVLLLLVLALVSLAGLGMVLIQRLPIRNRQMVVSACLAVAALFAWRHPPRAPMAKIDPDLLHVVAVVGDFGGCGSDAPGGAPTGRPHDACVVLVPVCFLAISFPGLYRSFLHSGTGARLRLGFLPSQIYFQYDYLMPMLAVGWHWVGGNPYAFSFVTQLSLYLFLLGCFLLARRLFRARGSPGLWCCPLGRSRLREP